MSCTEIYAFGKDGNAFLYDTVRNAWRGAMAVWNTMEERYLPLYVPEYVFHCNWYRPCMGNADIIAHLGFTPSRLFPRSGREDRSCEIWNLCKSEDVPERDRIVLATTLDDVLVQRAGFQKVIDAFLNFGGETNLAEQAKVLQKALDDENIIAIGWNQTSVSADHWANAGGYDDERDEEIPYNCLTMTEHWWLFSDEECDT